MTVLKLKNEIIPQVICKTFAIEGLIGQGIQPEDIEKKK